MPNIVVLARLAQATGVTLLDLVDGLAVPTRQPTRRELLALIEGQPGVNTRELAHMTCLPFQYVQEDARYMLYFGEIRRESGGWQPASVRRIGEYR